VSVRSWIVVDAVETRGSLCSEGRVVPVANHDNVQRAESPGDPTATREFIRNALDSPTAWMMNEVGASSEARSIVSPSGEPPTAGREELSAWRAAVNNAKARLASSGDDASTVCIHEETGS
jgi:hypothetical protein